MHPIRTNQIRFLCLLNKGSRWSTSTCENKWRERKESKWSVDKIFYLLPLPSYYRNYSYRGDFNIWIFTSNICLEVPRICKSSFYYWCLLIGLYITYVCLKDDKSHEDPNSKSASLAIITSKLPFLNDSLKTKFLSQCLLYKTQLRSNHFIRLFSF